MEFINISNNTFEDKYVHVFPQFSNVAKEMLIGYKDTLEKGLESNKESVQAYYDSCKTIIKTLEKQLDRENLSPTYLYTLSTFPLLHLRIEGIVPMLS